MSGEEPTFNDVRDRLLAQRARHAERKRQWYAGEYQQEAYDLADAIERDIPQPEGRDVGDAKSWRENINSEMVTRWRADDPSSGDAVRAAVQQTRDRLSGPSALDLLDGLRSRSTPVVKLPRVQAPELLPDPSLEFQRQQSEHQLEQTFTLKQVAELMVKQERSSRFNTRVSLVSAVAAVVAAIAAIVVIFL